MTPLLLGSDQRQEHVEGNLDTIDEEQSVLVGNSLEVYGMDERPDLPGSLAGGEKVTLDLVSDDAERVAVDKSEVSEKDGHEDGAPKNLVNGHLCGNRYCVSSRDLGINPVVEIVTRGPMIEETKGRERNKSLPLERSARNEDLEIVCKKEIGLKIEKKTFVRISLRQKSKLKIHESAPPVSFPSRGNVGFSPYLCQEVTESPSNERCEGLGGDRTLIQCPVVGCPSRNGTSTNDCRITEEWALNCGILPQGRLDDSRRRWTTSLRESGVVSDAKGTHTQCGGNNKETKELHGHFFMIKVGVWDADGMLPTTL
jgi:hypothetical protein